MTAPPPPCADPLPQRPLVRATDLGLLGRGVSFPSTPSLEESEDRAGPGWGDGVGPGMLVVSTAVRPGSEAKVASRRKR